MSDADRRSLPRHPAAALPARLRFGPPVRLLDLGAGGARIESSEWLAPGRCHLLRLGDEPALELAGVVTRCALVRIEDDAQGGAAVYQAAMGFEPLGAGAAGQLRRLLARFTDANAGDLQPSSLRLASGF